MVSTSIAFVTVATPSRASYAQTAVRGVFPLYSVGGER
jgi:hypothetical protein